MSCYDTAMHNAVDDPRTSASPQCHDLQLAPDAMTLSPPLWCCDQKFFHFLTYCFGYLLNSQYFGDGAFQNYNNYSVYVIIQPENQCKRSGI